MEPAAPEPAAPEGPAEPTTPAEPTAATWPEPAAPEGPPGPEPLHRDEAHEHAWPETTQLKQWLGGPQGQVLTGRTVLIVDDDIRNVFALTHVLGRVGISVKYAENGREGLEVLDRSPEVSLVLMDIMMPEMNGYEAIQRIRRTPRLAQLPVVALTAKAMSGDSEKALNSGADVYVAKPVDLDELLQAMYDLLSAPDAGSRAGARGGSTTTGGPQSQPAGDADAGTEPPGRLP
ncbi:response regulator [Streptomyces oryzae]